MKNLAILLALLPVVALAQPANVPPSYPAANGMQSLPNRMSFALGMNPAGNYQMPCTDQYGDLCATDYNNASFGASGTPPLTVTVGMTYPMGRSIQANCTAAGTITFTEAGTAVPWIVAVGTNEVVHATTAITASTGTCIFIIHY